MLPESKCHVRALPVILCARLTLKPWRFARTIHLICIKRKKKKVKKIKLKQTNKTKQTNKQGKWSKVKAGCDGEAWLSCTPCPCHLLLPYRHLGSPCPSRLFLKQPGKEPVKAAGRLHKHSPPLCKHKTLPWAFNPCLTWAWVKTSLPAIADTVKHLMASSGQAVLSQGSGQRSTRRL